jgi:hypothetical protein
MRRVVSILVFATWLVSPGFVASGAERRYDIVVYGGTSAAVTAAVEASQSGKSVAIVCPDKHLGGLSSGGLGFTDLGNKRVIGGLAREFYHRLYLHYQRPEAWKWQTRESFGHQGQGAPALDGEMATVWTFEPHAAEAVFEAFVKENNIPVFRNEWLDREQGVAMQGKRLVSFTTLEGNTYTARVFIDATYEGDLMAAAGVSYHVGRESSDTYGESLNGVQAGVHHHLHYFRNKIDPYREPGNPASGLLPRISPDPVGEQGSGDHRVQAYCYRLCTTDHPDNRVPFARPEGYDPEQYELLARVFAANPDDVYWKIDHVPNRKTDINNNGPFSTDNIGYNYSYPEASYAERQTILEEHRTYQQGLLYFLTSDERVPERVREQVCRWGLAKDEFVDSQNWPHQIYVREARRMIGQYVMTQADCLSERETPQSVGRGSYSMDSHNVQRYVTTEGYVQNEGDIGVRPPKPYMISFGSLLPKQEECENLLVPVCVSASHISYGSIRMEPVFMILGQSAAAAAVIAVEGDVPVQRVPYEKLKEQLEARGQVL